jgi:hypothetical protein
VLCLIERRQNGPYSRQKLAADLRWCDCPRRARQKPDPELALEISDDARDLRLRQSAFPRGGREAAEASDARV